LFGFGKKYNASDGYYWFKNIVDDTEHTNRITQVLNIKEYLLRKHKVLHKPDFPHKDEVYVSAKIVLNIIQSVLNAHISYLSGNPVSFNGNPDVVNKYNNIYKRGNYNKIDYEIVKDMYTFGNAFEYVYLDPKDSRIKSKIIANEDAIPVYDDEGNYTHFIEHWKDAVTSNEYFIIYYPEKVETYKNDRLVDTKVNLSGLPIHYSGIIKSAYRNFGEPMCNDLIPIIDAIENVVSRLDDAVNVYSMNPLGVVTGKQIKSSIPKETIGTILNLDDGNEFKFATAEQDYQSIKLELDTLWQQFYAIACIPSVTFGQSNVANVSETSLRLLYARMDDKGKETTMALRMGLFERYDAIRKLLAFTGMEFTDEDYDTLDIEFSVNRPIDTFSLMEELKIQHDMGAISIQTIIDKSPYTTDTATEMERITVDKTGADSETSD
jgi:Phage portal protein, SPP1 Gp6-like.